MQVIFVISILLHNFVRPAISICPTTDQEACMTAPEIIRSNGYPVEEHPVVTEDGYILTHQRIPHGSNGQGHHSSRPVVILEHGLVGDASGWLLNNKNRSIGFLLADAGYDVWLLNNRGTQDSQKRVNINSPPHLIDSFWDFSWHEMGVFDLPATIDYILEKTGRDKVCHIGHSQGTTALYVLLSEIPDYKKLIACHIGFAPVAYHYHTKNPLYKILSIFERLHILQTKFFRSINFFPRNKFTTAILVFGCSNGMITRYICEILYYAMMGWNPKELNQSRLATIYGHYPCSSSLKQFSHFVQGVIKPSFTQYDYEREGNMKRYGRPTPPEYKLYNVDVPIYNFYGDRDNFCQLPDVEKLHKQLPNLKEKNLVEEWAHYDFLYGKDAYEKVYKRTLQILNDCCL